MFRQAMLKRGMAVLVGLVLVSCGDTNTPTESEDIPLITWQKTFGGAGGDIGRDVIAVDDGYVIAGSTTSIGAGADDVYLLKVDTLGNLVWENAYGGPASEQGNALVVAPDGGFVVAGSTKSYGAGEMDVYLIKTDAAGNWLWERTFGGINYETAMGLAATADGGYILTGWTSSFYAVMSSVYVIKTDESGNLQWQKTYGGNWAEEGADILQTTDGGYIVAGQTESFGAGEDEIYVIKIDQFGIVEWEKAFGGGGNDWAEAIVPSGDGGYVMAGWTGSMGAGGYDAMLLKINGSGNSVWWKAYGRAEYDAGNALAGTADGGFVLGGHLGITGGGADAYLVKVNGSGNIIWEQTYGDSYEMAEAVIQTPDGGYVLIGQWISPDGENSDVFVLKTDATGLVP